MVKHRMYKLVKMAPINPEDVVREVYHRGREVAGMVVPPPFMFNPTVMCKGIPGRVEVAEFSPHFAYSYTV